MILAAVETPEVSTLVLLALAALFAGWIDAVVGGGGLIQLPALVLALPTAPVASILATNKVSSIVGTSAAATTYLRKAPPDLRTVIPMALVAGVAAAGGSALASRVPRDAFEPIVIVALAVVLIWTLRRKLPDVAQPREHSRGLTLLAAGGIGFYDGIIGPGTGAFLVVAIVAITGVSFLHASAGARIINVATNAGSLLIFLSLGAVIWQVGLVMAAANLVGGLLGAHTAINRGSGFVRGVLVVVVIALLCRLSWDVLTR